MRGRLPDKANESLNSRNTPAYAGKTGRMNDNLAGSWKHPRVCGEDAAPCTCQAGVLETPPRMRGRLHKINLPSTAVGNTPAYAGKTSPCSPECSDRRETPPRMRGRPHALGGLVNPLGNTPAYAGKTRSRPAGNAGCRKHPRVCGEDSKKN